MKTKAIITLLSLGMGLTLAAQPGPPWAAPGSKNDDVRAPRRGGPPPWAQQVHRGRQAPQDQAQPPGRGQQPPRWARGAKAKTRAWSKRQPGFRQPWTAHRGGWQRAPQGPCGPQAFQFRRGAWQRGGGLPGGAVQVKQAFAPSAVGRGDLKTRDRPSAPAARAAPKPRRSVRAAGFAHPSRDADRAGNPRRAGVVSRAPQPRKPAVRSGLPPSVTVPRKARNGIARKRRIRTDAIGLHTDTDV